MKILFISQVFYPDNVSVSQHVTDLSIYLVEKGHDVSVFSSKHPYESNDEVYSKFENHKGVKIFRINQSKFGKSKTIFRLMDFFTFYILLFIKLLKIKNKEFDIVIGTSVPPMLSVIGLFISKIKRIQFYYWIMDLQPELSISSGLLNKNSLLAKLLTFFGNYSIKNSDKTFSMDKYMSEYLVSRGANKHSNYTIPPWPVMNTVYNGTHNENPFRIKNNFGDKIVIMYSGNHAFVHPLDTILETARILENNKKFLFVFIGGGIRKKDVTNYKNKFKLNNIIQLPFQPRSNIHLSLGSADLQLVIMGENQVGYTHPNKIYGGLFIGKPIIYIGPNKSHVTDILNELSGNIIVNHGESKKIACQLLDFSKLNLKSILKIGHENKKYADSNYSPDVLKNKMFNQIINNA